MINTRTKIPETWLITGGCGFIGTNLVSGLISGYDCTIRVYDNLSAGSKEDLGRVCDFTENAAQSARVRLITGDILDASGLSEAARGADCMVHLAANTGVIPSIENPEQDCRTNVLGTLNALEAARANPGCRFIFASSGAPLGAQEPPIHENKAPKPVSPYGASKLAGEGYCSAYFGSFGVQTIALRFGNVYGPRSYKKGSVIAKFIKQILAGETLTVYGDGNQTRDFIYTGDLVDAILKSSMTEAGGEIFQIATSREYTINELLEALRGIFKCDYGKNISVKRAQARQGEVLRNYSDISKARKILGWSPKRPFEENLRETVRWFVENTEKTGFSDES